MSIHFQRRIALWPQSVSLTLKLSPSLLTVLSEAFDFTQLHTFRYSQSWTPELNAFLRRYGSTVQRLFVSNKHLRPTEITQDRRRPDATLKNIDIGLYFPALRELHLDSFPRPTISPNSVLHAMITRLPPNNIIDTLHIRADLYASPPSPPSTQEVGGRKIPDINLPSAEGADLGPTYLV
ncbi:hypothetical protein R3P38DRAFT_1254004 [Favolaschia claudopus]|uniref:Uncharacterized protein n=1 Tax=Favolaschia claudopus TaxID=2862362 RepID=A0AAW0B2Z9_9AGAR